MQLSKFSIALVLSVTTASFVAINAAHAQTRPTIGVRNLASDYHMFHSGEYVYRYDSKTGTTQRLVTGSAAKGVAYDWATILDQNAGPSGPDGRYEVGPGTNTTGLLVRIDRTTGRTWVAVQTNIMNWQEVTAK